MTIKRAIACQLVLNRVHELSVRYVIIYKTLFGRIFRFSGIFLALLLGACAQQPSVPTDNGTVSVITHYLSVVSVPAHKTGKVTARCQPGEEVVSGGFGTVGSSDSSQVVFPLNKTVILASYPSSTTSWTVVMLNREEGSVTLAAHIQCTTLTGSKLSEFYGLANALPATATCPGNTRLLGGGFRVDESAIRLLNSVINVEVSAPANATAWTTTIRPSRGSSVSTNTQVTTYAVCTSSKLKSILKNGIEVKAPPGGKNSTDGYGTGGCSANQLLLAAGFRIDSNDGYLAPYLFYADYSNTTLTWAFKFRSLVTSSIEGQPINLGGKAYLLPICGTVSS